MPRARHAGQSALLGLKLSARSGLRKTLGIEIRRVGRKRGAAGIETLPPPSPELVEHAERVFSASFPVSPSCPLPPDEIERRIASYYWHYPFRFGDRLVEADWEPAGGLDGRHFQRHLHVFPALLSRTGGSLEGKTVVDVGCNCGFWSIQARLAGAESVLGIEASEENVDQARFILDVTGLEGIEFEVGNAYDVSHERYGEFDVALYFGLLYHLEHPVLALERLYEVTRQLAVVDTTIVRDRTAVCRLHRDKVHEQNYSNRLRMVPSRSAVAMMLRHAGFREVLLVPRSRENLPPDYLNGNRETFIAIR